jgi:hypothetical protein
LLEREGITVLDLSALRGGDRLNHSKFAQSPEVVRLLGERLIAGQTVTDQDIGLGEQLGAPPSASPTRSAPPQALPSRCRLPVIDPATRDSLDDQADRFGQHLGNAGDRHVRPGRPAPRSDDAIRTAGDMPGRPEKRRPLAFRDFRGPKNQVRAIAASFSGSITGISSCRVRSACRRHVR